MSLRSNFTTRHKRATKRNACVQRLQNRPVDIDRERERESGVEVTIALIFAYLVTLLLILALNRLLVLSARENRLYSGMFFSLNYTTCSCNLVCLLHKYMFDAL